MTVENAVISVSYLDGDNDNEHHNDDSDNNDNERPSNSNAAATGNATNSQHVLGAKLMNLVIVGDYERLLQELQSDRAQQIVRLSKFKSVQRSQTQPEKDRIPQETTTSTDSTSNQLPDTVISLGPLLSTACYGINERREQSNELLTKVFQTVLDMDPNAAIFEDPGQRTPLHMVLMYLEQSSHLVRLLLQANRDCIRVRDVEGLRPIEVLTSRILMKEECLKVLKTQNKQQEKIELQDLWESARWIVLAHVQSAKDVVRALSRMEEDTAIHECDNDDDDSHLPVLHACLKAQRLIPLGLTELCFRRFAEQFLLPEDVHGNLPLHCIAQTSPSALRIAAQHAELDYGDDEEDEDDLLEEVVQKCKESARVQNRHGDYPLQLAIQSKRTWKSGIRVLLDAYPLAAQQIPIDDQRCLPIILEQLGCGIPGGYNRPSVVFALIKGNLVHF